MSAAAWIVLVTITALAALALWTTIYIGDNPMTTTTHLMDVRLASEFLSEAGADACPVCGYEIDADAPVVVTDGGEAHSQHVEDDPAACLETFTRDDSTIVLLGAEYLGTVREDGGWFIFPAGRRSDGPFPSRTEALNALVDALYPQR